MVFKKCLHPCASDQSSLSIGRVKMFVVAQKYPLPNRQNSPRESHNEWHFEYNSFSQRGGLCPKKCQEIHLEEYSIGSKMV